MSSETRTATRQLLPYVEKPTRLQRFCRHCFRFAVGFGCLLSLAGLLTGGVVQGVAGGAFLVTGVAAGYHVTE